MADKAFHVELDISCDQRSDHEAYVIIAALEEYAARHRDDAECSDNAEFHHELADTADYLRRVIDAQLGDANVIERPAS